MKLRIPSACYLSTETMIDGFRRVARERGLPETEADELFALLPMDLQIAPVFLCSFKRIWRYEYGEPIDRLPNDKIAFGTLQCPKVEWLFMGLFAAKKYVTSGDLQAVIARLASRQKHQDTLAEFAPLTRLGQGTEARYEVSNYGVGNRTIDWLISQGQGVPILLEVKNRIKDLVLHLSDATKAVASGAIEAPPPTTDAESLFKDTLEKFRPCQPNERLQGTWIHTDIKQKEDTLVCHYASLDQTRLHFVLLADWQDDAYVLARDEPSRSAVLRFFHLQESKRFVYGG